MGKNTTTTDMDEMQRLAGVTPADDGYQSFETVQHEERTTLREDTASGARGWLSGVTKSLATWKGKLSKDGASPKALAAFDAMEDAVKDAMGALDESAAPGHVRGKTHFAAVFDDAGFEDPLDGHTNWARALGGLNEASDADKARKLMVAGLWKKYKAQLHGTGYARLDGGKHLVRMKPDGDVSGDLIALSQQKDVALEDMPETELKTMFVKSIPWLKRFEAAWAKKNADAISALSA